MRLRRTLFSISFAASAVFVQSTVAQTTWNGFSFGSSPAEAQQVVSKQGLELSQNKTTSNRWDIQAGWDMKYPGSPLLVFHFLPQLCFSDAKLGKIILSLQGKGEWLQSTGETTGATGPEIGTVVISVYEQLISRYGAPATATATCNHSGDFIDISYPPHPRNTECKATWKGQGQTVTLSWYHHGEAASFGKLYLDIDYVQQTGGQSGL